MIRLAVGEDYARPRQNVRNNMFDAESQGRVVLSDSIYLQQIRESEVSLRYDLYWEGDNGVMVKLCLIRSPENDMIYLLNEKEIRCSHNIQSNDRRLFTTLIVYHSRKQLLVDTVATVIIF